MSRPRRLPAVSRFRILSTLRASAVAALLLVLGTSCNTFRLAYDNADWIVARAVGPYLCPTSTQEEALRGVVRDFVHWHRHAELPRYAKVFRNFADAADGGPLDDAAIARFFDAFEAARNRAAAKLAEPVAAFGVMLGPDQLRCLTVRLNDLRRENLAELKGDPKEWRKQRADEIAEQIEPWLGDLTATQKKKLAADLAPPDEVAAVLRARNAKSRRLITILRKAPPDTERAALRAVVTEPYALFEDDEEALMKRWDEGNRRRATDFLKTLLPKQRAHLARTLRRYAKDFSDLADGD